MQIVYHSTISDPRFPDQDSDDVYRTTIYELEDGTIFLVQRFISATTTYSFFLNGGQLFDTLAAAKAAAKQQLDDFFSVVPAP